MQAQPPQWAPAPAQAGADNGPAVLGFCLSISSIGLLLISGGLSTLLSVGLAIPGMLQSRKGTRRVRDGLTTRNEGLAKAGWVIGIVGLVLSVLATIFWVVIAVLVATNEEVRDEFERELDRELDEYERSSARDAAVRGRASRGGRPVVRSAAAALAAASMLALTGATAPAQAASGPRAPWSWSCSTSCR